MFRQETDTQFPLPNEKKLFTEINYNNGSSCSGTCRFMSKSRLLDITAYVYLQISNFLLHPTAICARYGVNAIQDLLIEYTPINCTYNVDIEHLAV